MKKHLSITSIILGLFSNIMLLYELYNFESDQIICISGISLILAELLELLTSSFYNLFLTLMGTIGFVISIKALTKYKSYNKKFLSIIGLIFNLVPTFLFSILLWTLSMTFIVLGFAFII